MRLPGKRDGYGYMTAGWFTAWFVAGMVGLMLAIASIAIPVDMRNCSYAQGQFKRDTHYDLLAGCYIQTDAGAYVSLDSFRSVAK